MKGAEYAPRNWFDSKGLIQVDLQDSWGPHKPKSVVVLQKWKSRTYASPSDYTTTEFLVILLDGSILE